MLQKRFPITGQINHAWVEMDGRDVPPEMAERQAFIVTGKRTISRRERELRQVYWNILDVYRGQLQRDFEAWCWISPVVAGWRRKAHFDHEHDFIHDCTIVWLYGRGWFDQPVAGPTWRIML